jgi:hypothetical protein
MLPWSQIKTSTLEMPRIEMALYPTCISNMGFGLIFFAANSPKSNYREIYS